jgi:integrase
MCLTARVQTVYIEFAMKTLKKQPAEPAQKVVFASLYGIVRVYTRRHINGCSFTDPNQQRCSCPKWIYSNPKAGQAQRLAAGTPSFTEACEKAQKILKGLDPEIRAAREITNPAAGISIERAIEEYLSVLAGRKVVDRYLRIVGSYLRRRGPRKDGHKNAKTVLNPSLLDFLDRENLTSPDPITRMEQITSSVIKRWQTTWRANDLTCRILRIKAKSFFTWALEEGYLRRLPLFDKGQPLASGNRCGHFTDAEYTRIIEALPFFPVPRAGHVREYKRPPITNYAARLRAFIEAGRWAGMAVRDIVLFSPARALEGNVLAYRRHKNRRQKNSPVAVIELYPDVAKRLGSIPAEMGSSAEQPFRFQDSTPDQNCELWRQRFQKLCAFAGIKEIETEIGERRKPHPHMLRDTCAIDAITHGTKLENVAKMLGHATTDMTQRSYLYWIQKRLDSCLDDQRASLARRVQSPIGAAPAAADDRKGDALRIARVH